MAQRPKNPLSVFFGAYIQDQRRQRFSNLTAAEFAKKLTMSFSLYKMTEAGLTSFSISRVITLLETIKDSALIFDRVLKFVGGQNIIDSLITNHISPQKAFESLNVDEEFNELFIKTERYFQLEDDSREQKEFVQSRAVEEVKLFLQNAHYTADTSHAVSTFQKQLINKIEYVPSLSMGLLFDFVQSFSHIIPLHSGDVAAKWEKENSDKFESLDGIFRYPDMIINEANFTKFHHSYLLEEKFNRVRYIFCNTAPFENEQNMLDQYKIILNRTRKDFGLREIPAESFSKKVTIKIIEDMDNETVRNLLRLKHTPTILSEAYWSFKMNSGNEIGFNGVIDSDVNKVYNLAYGDLMQKIRLFNSLWDSI